MTTVLLMLLLASAEQDIALHEPEVVAIGKLLRCPVCQGMPVSDSPSEMARAMMRRVSALHAEGKSREEILEHFVERYGEWVLLEPKAEGFNWLVWLLPPMALLLGVGLALSYGRRKPTAPHPTSNTPSDSADSDPYIEAIRKQI